MANNLSDALERVCYLAQIQPNDSVARELVIEQLDDSAGLNFNTDTIYREYYVVAVQFWLKPENNLIKGEGAEFNQNFEVTRRYLQMQTVIDKNLELIISPEYTCENLLMQLDVKTKRTVPSILSF